MPLPEIVVCPSTLRSGFPTYSPAAQAAMFGSRTRKVSHVLPFGPPGKDAAMTREFNEKRKRISISGVQEKYSLRQDRNQLHLTDTGGTHILKPVPSERLERLTDLPANEHLTMQLAKQVFDINTAACAMIFFDDGSPAYLTRRFDIKPEGSGRYQLEDFATLLGRTPELDRQNFKYDASYLDIATAIVKYCAASPVVLMDFFRRLIFNYLIANGDAHLKNFALMETKQGDFVLSPAYDLLCTALHLDDSLLALNGGLYEGDYDEKTFYKHDMYTGESFLVFAGKAGIPAPLATSILEKILHQAPKAAQLIQQSFLSAEGKTKFTAIFNRRAQLLSSRPKTPTATSKPDTIP